MSGTCTIRDTVTSVLSYFLTIDLKYGDHSADHPHPPCLAGNLLHAGHSEAHVGWLALERGNFLCAASCGPTLARCVYLAAALAHSMGGADASTSSKNPQIGDRVAVRSPASGRLVAPEAGKNQGKRRSMFQEPTVNCDEPDDDSFTCGNGSFQVCPPSYKATNAPHHLCIEAPFLITYSITSPKI